MGGRRMFLEPSVEAGKICAGKAVYVVDFLTRK